MEKKNKKLTKHSLFSSLASCASLKFIFFFFLLMINESALLDKRQCGDERDLVVGELIIIHRFQFCHDTCTAHLVDKKGETKIITLLYMFSPNYMSVTTYCFKILVDILSLIMKNEIK